MKRDAFRLAIIGCGKIAASHLEAALTSESCELAALVDPARDRAEALAERYRLKTTIAAHLTDVSPAVDGAVIATPNHTHADLAEACLRAGVSVLIEKPLALTAQEGERICRASRETGRTAAVGYVTRFRENVQLMAALIATRYFGPPHRFAYQFGTRGGWAPLSAYNLSRQTSGGGVLMTTGTHFVDRMLYWFGVPDEASLEDDSRGGPEANAVLHVRYGGNLNLSGTARFSKTVGIPAGFVMETERGTVILRDGSDSPIILRPADRPDLEVVVSRRKVRAAGGSEFVKQLDDFMQAVRGQRPPAVTAEDGLRSLVLLDGVYATRCSMSLAPPSQGSAVHGA